MAFCMPSKKAHWSSQTLKHASGVLHTNHGVLHALKLVQPWRVTRQLWRFTRHGSKSLELTLYIGILHAKVACYTPPKESSLELSSLASNDGILNAKVAWYTPDA
ncbi:hypothetical protein PIB30_096295, partial [Stylosanthes scabra]|nr:hypothetical protein [Stylosanthes scabra]